MAIYKIDKSQIDFSKIYGNKQSCMAHDNNTIKAAERYWGDTDDLYYDDETGMVSEGGVGLGFVNIQDLMPATNNAEAALAVESTPVVEETPTQSVEEVNTEMDFSSMINETPAESAPAVEEVPQTTVQEVQVEEVAPVVEEVAPEVAPAVEETPQATIQEVQVEEVAPAAEEVAPAPEAQPVVEEIAPESTIQDVHYEEAAPVVEEIAPEVAPAVEAAPAETIQDVNVSTGNVNEFVQTSLYAKISGNTDRLNEMIYFLRGKGLNDAQIAGVIGNSASESCLDLNSKNPISTATGLFQWLSDRHPESWDFNTQMEHMWSEYLTRVDRKGITVSEHMEGINDPVSACKTFSTFFEGYEGDKTERIKFAEECYEYLKSI